MSKFKFRIYKATLGVGPVKIVCIQIYVTNGILEAGDIINYKTATLPKIREKIKQLKESINNVEAT